MWVSNYHSESKLPVLFANAGKIICLKNYRDKKEILNYNIGHTDLGHEVGSRQRLTYIKHAQI